MENIQFEIEEDEFECVQCNETVKIPESCKRRLENDPDAGPCIVTCKCGTVFLVGKDPNSSGFVITEKTGSGSELEEIEEEEMEDE